MDSLSISDGCLQCGPTVTPTEGEEFRKYQKCGLLNVVKIAIITCLYTSLSKHLMEIGRILCL